VSMFVRLRQLDGIVEPFAAYLFCSYHQTLVCQ
jgi:hypothetical protein